MDVSSRRTRNGKKLATGQGVTEMNHTCEEKNISNCEDREIHIIGESGDDTILTPGKTISEHENKKNELSQSDMDVSSRRTQNGKKLATGKGVTEMNHTCKEKNINNHENREIHIIGESGDDTILTPGKTVSEHENKTNELSQSTKRMKGRPRKTDKLVRQSPRILRSRSQEKPKIPESVDVPSQSVETKEKKRRKKKIDKDQNNEFSKIKSHLRYLLSRMSYEQNFIEAYVGEGWKGQSLEKLKPEKEIERAKADIYRYKVKIRALFQRIDTSCEEGRIPESLYDSEGLIDSEDIFCSKCGQTEVRLDNDIILCDGACERGFHQFCLEPPLLKEQVPPGDEGWLCPACDCKVDCFDLLNDAVATNLSINDNWEKVFPETVASGNNLDDNSGLLSDDSGDDDYNPDAPQVEDEADAEDSSSDESDFSAASEDLGAVANNDQFLGLPSDDSEDDDFNPDKPESEDEAKEESSSSDFTSDFDDLHDIKNGVTSPEVQEPEIPENDEEIPKTNMEDDDFAPITAKRHVERLDYKKLHDETYGDISSDSSDEEFIDSEAPKKRKNTKGAKDMESNKKLKETEYTPMKGTTDKQDVEGTSRSPALKGSNVKNGTKSSNKRLGEASAEVQEPEIPENDEEIPKTNMITAKRHVERLDYKSLRDETYGDVSSDSSDEEFIDSEAPKKRKNTKGAKDMEPNKKLKETEYTPVKGTTEKQDVEGTSKSPALKGSNVKNGTKSSSKRLGEAATQRLYESFKENHYPDQNTREILVKELNLTHTQVRKWFENARWSFNHPKVRSKTVKSPPKPAEEGIVTKQAVKSSPKPAEEAPKPAEEAPKPAEETSKPAEEAPKPTEEAPKPAEEVIVVTKQPNGANSTTPKSRKKKTKVDHQASPVSSNQTITRRSSRVQAKRS